MLRKQRGESLPTFGSCESPGWWQTSWSQLGSMGSHCPQDTASTPQPSGTPRHHLAHAQWLHHFGTPMAGFALPPCTQQVLWCLATYADSGQVYFCIWQIMLLYQGSDYLPWWTSVIYSSFWSGWFKKKEIPYALNEFRNGELDKWQLTEKGS